MNLEARKIEFIQEFLKLQSEEVVLILEQVLRSQTLAPAGEAPDSTTGMEELNLRIDRSESDFDENRFKSSEELLLKYK